MMNEAWGNRALRFKCCILAAVALLDTLVSTAAGLLYQVNPQMLRDGLGIGRRKNLREKS
jgi:hypothetical protein